MSGRFPTVEWPLACSTDQTLSWVRSLVTRRVRSRWSRCGTSLELIGRCCWRVRSLLCRCTRSSLSMPRWWIVTPVCPVILHPQRPITALMLVAARQLIGHVQSLQKACPVTSAELVSSWSYVRLGSHLCAWTFLDILDLHLCYFRSCLRCWSSNHLITFLPSHVLHPIELQNKYSQTH
jgi:hypothetical protein